MKFLTWSFFVLVGVSILLTMFIGPPKSPKENGESSAIEKPKTEEEQKAGWDQPVPERLPRGAVRCESLTVYPDRWTSIRVPRGRDIRWDENAKNQVEILIGNTRMPYRGGFPENLKKVFFRATFNHPVKQNVCFYRR